MKKQPELPTGLPDGTSLSREVIRLAIPAILLFLLHHLQFITDSKFIGEYAGQASGPLAALGAVGPIVWSIVTLATITAVSATALVGRRVGEGNMEKAQEVVGTATLLALGAGILVAALAPFGESIIRALVNPREGVPLGPGGAYLFWYLLLFPLRAIAVSLEGCLRGAGDTLSPMLAGGTGFVANIVLNWIFIFGAGPIPAMGVEGAGLATALAGGVELVAILLLIRAGRTRLPARLKPLFTLHPALVRPVLAIARPAFVEALVFHAGFLVYQRAIMQLSQDAIAGHRVALTIQSLAFLSANGFYMSATAITGRLLGAGRLDLAQRAAWVNVRVGLIFMLPICTAYLLAADPLVCFFSENDEVRRLGAAALAIGAIEIPFLLITEALRGTLRGAGDTRATVIIQAMGTWALRVPLAWFFAMHLGWGLQGIWIATVIDWAGRAVPLVWMVRRRKWYELQI